MRSWVVVNVVCVCVGVVPLDPPYILLPILRGDCRQNLVLELMGVVTMLPPDGHKLALDAMTAFKESKAEKLRFFTLVEALKVCVGMAGGIEE